MEMIIDEALMERAGALLRAGGLVAFPTETVYGLGANATDAAAVRRIFEVKQRPATSPLIVHVDCEEMAREYAAEWPQLAADLAARFWPGPLTLVLPKKSIIPDEVTAGLANRRPARAGASGGDRVDPRRARACGRAEREPLHPTLAHYGRTRAREPRRGRST